MFVMFRLDHDDEMLRWDAFVDAHPEGTPLHRSGWLRTIGQTYAIDPWLFVSEDDAGAITALAPFFRLKRPLNGYRLVSLPFSDFCGPLGLEKTNVHQLLQKVLERASAKIKHIEIRGPLADAPAFGAHFFYKRHILRLRPDPQEVLKGVDKRTIQYNIRKARREGVTIIEDNTLNGIGEFYRLYLLTRKKHGVPHQPKRFFLGLAQNLVDQGRASVLLAAHGSRVVAGGLFMKHGKTVYYKYNVSDPTALAKIVPNHLLTWTAIERACLEGYEALDFGRTSPENAGLMRYKHMWGAEVQDLPYSYYPASFSKDENRKTLRLAMRIWRHLPGSVVSRLSPALLKYLG